MSLSTQIPNNNNKNKNWKNTVKVVHFLSLLEQKQ